jgi:hypothetical protein
LLNLENQLKQTAMKTEEIIEKIVEMLCDMPIDDQLGIIEEAKIAIQDNWDEMCSAAMEGYVP